MTRGRGILLFGAVVTMFFHSFVDDRAALRINVRGEAFSGNLTLRGVSATEAIRSAPIALLSAIEHVAGICI